ncbi:MAG: asparagine synthase (glutamine-hydrolyzing) [Romboutsia sp.]
MCGHVSIYYKNKNKKIDIKNISEKINHRGPNHTGFFNCDKVDFAFKRLSIIDIENGSQPFEKGNSVIVFNGEIYNHKELKKELIEKGYEFKTKCDTESLLTTYLEYGENCVDKLRGMYAFIIYDKEKDILFGARDHFGIKPLYYMEDENIIAFSSEYKAILELVDDITISEKNVQSYLSFQYVPNSQTLIENIKLVPPGHRFVIKNNKIEFKKYNDINLSGTKEIKAKDIQNVIVDSISRHMEANVSVGTFLSGGIDSTIVAAIASGINPNIKSFSVGFGIEGYNEVDVAKKTACKLGIENIEVKVSQDEYIKALPKIVYYLDDPVADPSEVGIYFLSKEASKYVTVVLSGEGADELFGGYNIYKEYNSIKRIINMPLCMRRVLNNISKSMPDMRGKSYLYRATTPLEERYIGNAKIFENDEVKSIFNLYKEEWNYKNRLEKLYQNAKDRNYDYVTTMQHIDINTWLEGDILQKADKMSMAASIELRVPFLDKEVLNMAGNLSLNQKISNSNTKVLLREAFKDIVPEHIVEKKKLGFPTPIRVWLKEDLGKVVRKTIKEAKVDKYINKDYAIDLLDDHIEDKKDNSRKIWTVFMFCLWHQIFVERKNIIF